MKPSTKAKIAQAANTSVYALPMGAHGEPQYADKDALEAMRFLQKQNKTLDRSLRDKELSKNGRMSPYQLSHVYRMAQQAMSMIHIGYVLGYTPQQLRGVTDKDPRVKWMYLAGRAAASQFATRMLWKKIQQGDNACLIFYLKTQLKWSEKVTVSLEHDLKDLVGATDGTMLKDRLNGMTTQELMEMATLLERVEARKNALTPAAPAEEAEDVEYIERSAAR